jgi:hypothetical protein
MKGLFSLVVKCFTKNTNHLRFKRHIDGSISFTVTSDGTTVDEWVKRFRVDKRARSVLFSGSFKCTLGVVKKVVVVGGFDNTDWLGMFALRNGLKPLKLEDACLIRHFCTNDILRKMGFHKIVVVHDRGWWSPGGCYSLSVCSDSHHLYHSFDMIAEYWDAYSNQYYEPGIGFAFAVDTNA